MATQVEISTVAAVRAVQALRQTVVALDKALKPLGRTIAKLNTRLGQGAGAKEFSRAQRIAEKNAQRLSKELIRQERVAARLRRQLRAARTGVGALGRSQAAATGKAKGLNQTLRNLGSSAIFAVGPLSGIGARLTAFGAIAGRTKLSVALLAVSFVALTVAVFKTIKAMAQTTIEVNKIQNALKVATGSTQAANREFQFLVNTSRRLSLDISKVGQQFAQITAAAKGTTLAGQGVRDIFTAISTASVVLSLSSEQTEGALRAIQQIISKGTVQAEELRGQLGERLPGAFQIAARAMGVTTKALGKLLELGLVISDEFIPKFSAELLKMVEPEVEGAVNQLTAAMNKLRTEFFLLFKELEEKSGIVEELTEILLDLGFGFEVINKKLGESGGLEAQLEKIGEALEKNERLTTNTERGLKRLEEIYGTNTSAARKLREELAKLFLERLVLEGRQRRLIQAGEGETFGPPAPTLTFDELRNLPIGPVDKFKDSLQDMRAVLRSLQDSSLSIKGKLGVIEEFERTAKATEAVTKVIKKLGSEELEALRTRFDGTKRSMEEVRELLGDLIKRFLEAKDAINETTKSLEKIDKTREKAKSQIEELKGANAILRLRIAGLDKQADAMEIRNKVEEDYGGVLLPKTKAETIKLLTLNEKLTEELKKQGVIKKLEEQLRFLKTFNDVLRLRIEGLNEEADALQRRNELEKAFKSLRVEAGGKEAQVLAELQLAAALEKSEQATLKLNLKATESISIIEKQNDVLRLRIAGLRDEADAMKIRNEIEAKYGKELLPAIRDRLIEVKEAQRQLKEEIKAVTEAEKEAERVARDFAHVFGDAVEDIAFQVTDLKTAIEDLFESIRRLIFRELVAKPFEDFLTNLISGAGAGADGEAAAKVALTAATVTQTVTTQALVLVLAEMTIAATAAAAALSAVGGSGAGDFLSGLLGSGSGLPGAGTDPGVKLSHGGSFRVGGVAGVDRNRVTMDLTRGETVTVTPANQNAMAVRPLVINVITRDPDTFVESPDQVALRGANIITRAKRRSR